MYQETLRFLIGVIVFSLCLFGVAALLSGCEDARRIAAYCLENQRNCD